MSEPGSSLGKSRLYKAPATAYVFSPTKQKAQKRLPGMHAAGLDDTFKVNKDVYVSVKSSKMREIPNPKAKTTHKRKKK